ncbi:hypothetical protein TBH_C0764 [Thiolapillus brandeum]|uniref:HprK-related kinase B n=1 Tax=Thiolapillus brandeum TaxID=1076588 RepID=A0A7U6JGS4_9GAMM|nr:hypothetical protein TBH_C0764 [Thiolapillus brandeum]
MSDAQVFRIEQRYGRAIPEQHTRVEAIQTGVCKGDLPVHDDPLRYSENNLYTPLTRQDARGLDVEGYGFQARIDLKPGFHGQLWGENEILLARSIVFENYLRTVAAYAALQRRGLFLHSAGIVVDNQAWLFLGRSGAGKTTLSRLALKQGADILSDDANMLLPDAAGRYHAGPVPFAGELGDVNKDARQDYPVAGLLWLEQDDCLECADLPPAQQLARTMACCPVVNVDPFRGEKLLDVIENLLKQVPMRVLHFRKTDPFEAILKAIGVKTDA